MAYSPLEVDAIRNGMIGTDSAWTSIVSNHNELYSGVWSPIFLVAGLSTSSSSASFVDHLRFWLPKNLDNRAVAVFIHWASTSGTASAKASVGSAVSSIITTSSSSYAVGSMTVTPSGSDDGRECLLTIQASGSGSVKVRGLTAYVSPSAASAGTSASGFAPSSSGSEFIATGAYISTERVARLINGPIQIAQDRPATLLSLVDDIVSPRSYTSTSANFAVVARAMISAPDPGSRTVRVHAYLADGGTGSTPAAQIVINGQSGEVSGTGWRTCDLEVDGGIYPPRRLPASVALKNGGTGTAYLQSLQIRRLPSSET